MKDSTPIGAITLKDRFTGALLGLACGDAVGTTVEFLPRGTFPPVKDMVGGGRFRLRAGQWTDDSSMALCLAESLIEKQGFDPLDQIQRYHRWYRDGYWSSTGRCFDIGNTTKAAMHYFEATGEPFSGPTATNCAGNGSTMRLAPIPLFYFPNLDQTIIYAGESSRTTHGTPFAIQGCQFLALFLHLILRGIEKNQLLPELFAIAKIHPTIKNWNSKYQHLAEGTFLQRDPSTIMGTGYVLESLEAALYCFLNSDSFTTAVLMSANLGDDADTTAAVAGQVAGAYYGANGIPEEWRQKLWRGDEIEAIARGLMHHDPPH